MSVLDEIFGPASAGRSAIPTDADLGATRRAALPQPGGIGANDAIERLLAREGGYSDHAADRGGKTNFGISSKAYPDLDVSKLTRDDAAQIYKRDYWDAIGADQLDPKIREIAFDAAVNHGAGTARKLLAQSGGDPQKMLALRQQLYDNLAAKDPSQKAFSAGWRNRLAGLSPVGTAQAEEAPDWETSLPMPSAAAGGGGRDEVLDSIFGGDLPERAAPEQGVGLGDFGKALAITGGDFTKAPVAALENLVGQLSGEGETLDEQALAARQRDLGDIRRGIGEWQKGFFQSMSPEALDRAERELLTLDPEKTIWQGGAGEFMSSIALKGTLSLGPTIGPMITTALLARLGVGAAASTLYGTQEGLMSAGLSAAQIADDIEQTPIEELRKVERFKALEAQMGETEARRQYVNEVQGIIPAVTGVLVGAIAKAVGKPLDKIFGTGEGLPLFARARAGAITETLQEGPQSFVEQVTQNYAKMAYDSGVSLLDGAAEQTVQGMLLGGIMGGTFAAAFGNRPQNSPMTSDPIPADVRAALSQNAEARDALGIDRPIPPSAGTPPPAGGGGPAVGGAIPTEPPGPDISGMELAPDAPQVADRFAPSPAQEGQGGIPFEPQVIPTPDVIQPNAVAGTIPFPGQEEAAAGGRRKKPKAPKGAIPLSLAEADVPDTSGLMVSEGVPPDVQAAVPYEPKPEDTVQPDFLPPEAAPPEAGMELAPPVPYDVNQTREPKHGQRTRTEMLGYRVRLRGPDGEILQSQLFETGTQARLKAHQMERALRGTNDGRRVEVLPARRTFLNDQTPTAEPVSDIVAQVKAMNAGDPERQGVYITRESLDNLREAGQLDQVLRGGIPIRNFDTYGGILLARDEATAQELMQFIEDPKSNIDEVIGYATGAGNGKPGGTNPVVQLLDDDGNVIRERQVTPEEAEPTKAAWGPNARIMPLEQALAIRQNRMQREKAERGVADEQTAFTATRPDEQVDALFNENPITRPFTEKATEAAKQGGFEEDIGGRLTDIAVEQREQELKRRKLNKGVPAPEDVKFRGREVVERSREETRLRREGKTTEADAIRSSIGGGKAKRDDLGAAYKDLYGRATDAALKLMEARISGSVQGVTDAEAEYETLLGELRAFYDMEGGYTKAEAIQRAANRYSPKGTKETIRAVAAARQKRQEAADRKEEEELEPIRAERERRYKAGETVGSERIISRGDTPREERKLRNIAEAEKVSVETMAAKLQRIRKYTQSAEGQRLVENLFMLLSPSVGRDLDQVVDTIDASEQIARLDKMRAQGRLTEKRYEWRKKLATRRAEVQNEKRRAAVAGALLETNQLLRQWLSDYRLALRYATRAGDKEANQRNWLLAQRAGELSEMLGQLKAYHQGDISISDDAARYLAHRISRMVVIGKRVGVGSEMDIDGFWEASAKGPMAFRDYLADTVQAREDLPFPTDLTEEKLQGVTLGTLNALYVKALEHLDGSRETDGQRREMVKALKNAITERVGTLSDIPETVTVEVWDRKKHAYVTIKREISPRKLMAETFRRSYGLRGADSRMSMEQLKELYLKGGTVTVWENGYVDFGKDGKHPPKVVKKGKAKTIKIPPISDKLPEPLPLSVLARRVTPEKKRKVILRAVRNMDRKQYGGKSRSTGLTRTSTSDTERARAESKYNPGVLLEDVRPREMSADQSAAWELKRREATVDLSDALSSASSYIAQLETAKFKKASGDPQGFILAKAYFRWLVEYGQTLANANLKSYAGFDEMNRVTVGIRDITTYSAEEFVEKIEKLFRAEMNEQVFRTVSLDPMNLKGLSDPTRRAEMTAESHDRVRKHLMFHKRLTEIWPQHPLFQQHIAPVLNKIAESIAVRHRGDYQTSRGWPIAQFTQEERDRVMAILNDWKTAKDERNYVKAQKVFREWGIPLNTLYDDFYLPLYEMLRNAGFIDPDVALLKQYNRRFTAFEDQSTGPVAITVEGENWMGQRESAQRWVSVSGPDPVAQATAELDRRYQEKLDQQLVAMDDDDAADPDTTITDRGSERKLTDADRKRRKGLINSPIGKTATSARKLMRGNEIIAQFAKTLDNPNASVRSIELAEQRMLNQLAEIGLYRPTGTDLGTIGLPDAAPIIAEIQTEQASIEEALSKIKRNEESSDSLLDSKGAKEMERLTEELQASREALDEIRRLQLGNKKARTMAYRSVGKRLVAGELTKEQAKRLAGEKLTGFWVRTDKAQRLRETPAKRTGDMLKERARREASGYRPEEVTLQFDITTMESDYGKGSPTEYDAFFALRDRLANDSSTMGELLASLRDKLPADHKYQPLIRRLLVHAAHRRVPVRFSAALDGGTTGQLLTEGGSPVVLLNENAFMQAGFNPLRAMHVVLHEMVHAATVRAMVENRANTDALNMLRQIAKERLGNAHAYATSNVFEFVAEAYTNSQFQNALKNISVENSTLWTRFVNWVRDLLGINPQHDNVLEYVMALGDGTFGPSPFDTATSRKVDMLKRQQEADDRLSPAGRAAAETIDFDQQMKMAETLRRHREGTLDFRAEVLAQNEDVQALMARAKAMVDSGKESGSSMLFKAMSMRQLAQVYKRHFGYDSVNPLAKYMKAFEARNSYSSELLEDADKLSRRWTALEEADEKAKTHHAVELSRLMYDATVEGVHADKAGSSLYARYSALSPAAQQLYKDVREYYKATQIREVQLMLANALRASKLWTGGEIDHETIDLEGITKGDWLQKFLGIDVKAEEAKLKTDAKTLDKRALKARESDLENTKEELKLIARMASIPSMQEGPYFPLMRFGDYAVSAERTLKTEVYATRKERADAMDAWRERDPTLQFNFPETDDGTFPLTVKEVEFRLAETRTDAEAARQELMQLYPGGTVSPVQLKQSLVSSSPTIESNSALQTLLGRLQGNAAAQAAIREFYIKSLSDRSFRKREARRKNIRGAEPTKQHRTFGAYSKSASYYTAQLRYGHVMAEAKAEMRKAVKGHTDESQISAVRMGQLVREIEIRDEQAATLTDTPKFVRAAVETGQLWLLLSPSYWMINATQPYLVTIPWLAARSSLSTATAEMAKAQKLILDPLITQGIESWGGLKALKSRLAAEKAFSVLENVTGSIESRMRAQGQDPKPVLDMLTALKRESIIDLSFVAELRDIAEGEEQGAWNKVMDASRVLAHLTEVNNRITTAIAAFNVAKGSGLDDDAATAFAKNAVAETQFDYSAANKPRLFSANDAWWKPIVFQFMQYVQHMYVLFIRHSSMWWNAPRGSQEAKIGRRVVLGLLATHMAAGGLLGATPQLAKWAIGLTMMLFGAGDDEDRDFRKWVSGDYYDRTMADAIAWLLGDGKAGEAARAGLPRLAGFDLSSRVAFLQSHFVDLDTSSKQTLYGSIATSFGGPMFGIFGNAFDSIELLAQGDADKAAEKLLPKLGRDAIRAWRYASEGMVDNTGKTIIGADEMSPWEIFLTSMGFAPSQVAEVYARNSKARDAEAFISRRKAEIKAAYRKSRSTGEINSVMADLREFNRQFPNERITRSELIRSLRQMQKAERNIQRYGVDAGKDSRRYDDDTYNAE